MRFGILILLTIFLIGCGNQHTQYSATTVQTYEEQNEETEEYVFTDALGRTVAVNNPERVAALLGSFADIWYLAGGEIIASADDAWDDLHLDLSEEIGRAHV